MNVVGSQSKERRHEDRDSNHEDRDSSSEEEANFMNNQIWGFGANFQGSNQES